MKCIGTLSVVFALITATAVPSWSQEPDPPAAEQAGETSEQPAAETGEQPAAETGEQPAEAPAAAPAGETGEQSGEGTVEERAEQTLESARETVGALAEKVEQSEKAQEVSAGILEPIYQLAETFSFPAFHWLAFAAMVAGVIGFGLQLTLGKLVVLTRLGFSLSEIISDALGLVVSLVGLVLTTQAAAENSTFTESAFAVLSSTLLGALVGLLLYLWGQRQELQAVEGRKRMSEKDAGRRSE